MHENENLKTGHLAWQLPPDYDVELSVVLVLYCKCVSKNKQKNEIELMDGVSIHSRLKSATILWLQGAGTLQDNIHGKISW